MTNLLQKLTKLFHRGTVTASDGGVAALGDVRNNTIIQYITRTEGAATAELLKTWLDTLAHRCAQLPLGAVDPKFNDPNFQVRLPAIYTDLSVVSAPRDDSDESEKHWGLRMARGEGERMGVVEALNQQPARLCVLLGDAGGGKSTLVNYLTWKLASAARDSDAAKLGEALADCLPVRLILRDLGGETDGAELLWAGLRRDMQRVLGDPDGATLFNTLQPELRKRGLFLLDGLDETPEGAARQRLLNATAALAAELSDNARVLVTARPYAYADRTARLPGFDVLALAPLNADQAARLVQHFYQAIRASMSWDETAAGQRAASLNQALQERTDLGDLAARPLLLTLIAAVHVNRAQLPDGRADLYEESVDLLLHRWESRLVELDPARAGQAPVQTEVRDGLEQLAWETHQRQAASGATAAEAADIKEREAYGVLAPHLSQTVNPTEIVRFLEQRAGLLIGRGTGQFAFLHRSFQEYLAACYLTEQCEDLDEQLAELLADNFGWWREVFLLVIGKRRQGGMSGALALLRALLPESPSDVGGCEATHCRKALAVGLALLELQLPPKGEDLRKRAALWLAETLTQGELELRERAEAGDVLARLGDPRAGVALNDQQLPDFNWVTIPAGEFLLGSTDDEPDTYDDEKPQQRLTLPSFRVARYPVTNAQYAAFVDAGGYADEQWWDEKGWAWRHGDNSDVSSIKDEKLRKNYENWLKQRTVAQRGYPRFWHTDPWNRPNRPVVGVCWYEARAFCRWLSAQTGETIRLPTEAEWERAARGTDGRRFPWDADWREDAANTSEAELETTLAVGAQPAGYSPEGVAEMCGNVWEWTGSLWGEDAQTPTYAMPYDATDGREDQTTPGFRIVRGAGWANDQKAAQCACRYWLFPGIDYYDTGFRVVSSPANSEF